MTESLQLTISDWLTELVNINNEKKLSSNLLDLYCGSGFFSIQNAQLFNQVSFFILSLLLGYWR